MPFKPLTATVILIMAAFIVLLIFIHAVLARETAAARLLTIHYHRFEGDYPAVGIWTWDGTGKKEPSEPEIVETGRDDFGLVFRLNPDDYGTDPASKRIGLLPRMNKDWDRKDGGDRYWTPDMGLEIWLIQGSDMIHRKRPDVSPKVLLGCLDAEKTITAYVSHSIAAEQILPGLFTLKDGEGLPWMILKAEPLPAGAKKTTRVRLEIAAPLPFESRTFTLSARGYAASSPGNVIPRDILSDPEQFLDRKTPLGAAWSRENTVFRVFAPTAEKVFIVLYDKPAGGEGRREALMKRIPRGIWETTIPGDLDGVYYVYRLEGPHLNPALEVIDPYARAITGREGRGIVVNLDATSPPGFNPRKRPPLERPTDAVIYETHVHDFTVDPKSGIQNRGLYTGFGETGGRLEGEAEIRTGMDHLLELGINHVQLMPIQAFDHDEEVFHQANWGYMPVHFNSPDGWFATRRDDATRIREFKQLVHDCHERGIRVIMDVVYNHTAPPASFEKIVPGYYFRLREDGSFWNGSGCGNEFRTENPMARRFIIDSLIYWATEYGVDGFRFDLMGLIDPETMKEAVAALKAVDPSLLIYGEPWAAGESGLKQLTSKGSQKGLGFGAFNDDFRDAVKGSTRGDDGGFIQNGGRIEELKSGIMASIHKWAEQPSEAIEYAACHDDMTLWDKIVKSTRGVPDEKRRRMQKMAGALIFTSQGIPFLHSGQEMCRTKGGVESSWNASEEINMIHWGWKKEYRDVFEYHKGLIALRKAHPAFRMDTRAEIEKRMIFLKAPSPKSLLYTIDTKGLPGETAAGILVFFNADENPATLILPEGRWAALVLGDKAGAEMIEEVGESIVVEPFTSFVAVR